MSDHPATVEGALKWAEVCAECFADEALDMTSVALQTLAAEVRRLRTTNDAIQGPRSGPAGMEG